MNLKRTRALVLGGSGLVGSAVVKRLLSEGASRVAIVGHRQDEVVRSVQALGRGTFSDEGASVRRGRVRGYWGDMFLPRKLKERQREDILNEPALRQTFLRELFGELSERVLSESFLYWLIEQERPALVVDAVNTSTALAYQDIYSAAGAVLSDDTDPREAGERALMASYIPQLIRHMQILGEGCRRFGVLCYAKVGTTGTGGMGWDIPYTHGEERPSRVLLSKSAMAGAQSLLTLVLGRANDGPAVVEVKPGALIGWRSIGEGEIMKKGRPIPLYRPGEVELSEKGLFGGGEYAPTGRNLRTAYVDTGENGVFSLEEFKAVTSTGQMEFVTPEEIADALVEEVQGRATGLDVIAGLESTIMGPSFRAGQLRADVLARMERLLAREGTRPSVAFEILGPPRASKLLFEAYILKACFGTMASALQAGAERAARAAQEYLEKERELLCEAVSVGIPVLLPNGKRLLRGPFLNVPKSPAPFTPENVDRWTEDGWIDLRPSGVSRWMERFRAVLKEARSRAKELRAGGASSGHGRRFLRPGSLSLKGEIDPGELVAWVFITEEKGGRRRS